MLTTKQLADELQVSTKTIWNWVAEKRIPYVRTGNGPRAHLRFDLEKVLNRLNRVTVERDKAAEADALNGRR